MDVHYRTTTICILGAHGQRVKTKTIRGPWRWAIPTLRALKQPFKVVFEASCGYGPLYDTLRGLAEQVLMAHPGRVRLIFRSARKNDRVDAEKLAVLLYMDQVPTAYVPSESVRQWRELIEFRRRAVDQLTVYKNQIRALIRGRGWTAPRKLWNRKGLAWLRDQGSCGLLVQVRCETLLANYAHAQKNIRLLTRALDQMGRRHPGVILLRTIPGVGPRTAETVVAYIDDARRFSRGGEVSSYFGLVPRQDASAGINRLGHITKQGPGTARKYLVQAAWQAVRRSETVRRRFERIAGDRRDRKKIALVGVAQWLLRCMHAMLCSGEAWRETA
jgi:transposase